jgi:hypothetical protein
MQTDVWMTYSCLAHFSKQFSHITHFISSYHLKDINFASFKHFLPFSRKTEKKQRRFSPRWKLAWVTDVQDQELLTGQLTRRKLQGVWWKNVSTRGCGWNSKAAGAGLQRYPDLDLEGFFHRGCSKPERLTGGVGGEDVAPAWR